MAGKKCAMIAHFSPTGRSENISDESKTPLYPFAGLLGNGLRAAGDVRFGMYVSISLTIGARLLFSALFGLWLGWGVIGVTVGMSIDLVFRGTIFLWRLRSQKWTQFQVI